MKQTGIPSMGLIALLLQLSSNGILAESTLRLETTNVQWRGGKGAAYDVFDAMEYAQTVHFRVRLTGEPCAFFITLDHDSPGEVRRHLTSGTEQLDFQIYQSLARRTSLKDLPVANNNEVIAGVFSAEETVKELSFVMVVPPEQVKPAGWYTGALKMQVHRGTLDNYTPQDSQMISFSVWVDEITELSLVDAGGVFNPKAKAHKVEFSKLTRGRSKGFDLRVRSNTAYRLELQSENGGLMRHVDSGITTTIPYTLQLENRAVAFTAGFSQGLDVGKRMTDRHGMRHPANIIIGEVGNALAGTYRDTLTITVVSGN